MRLAYGTVQRKLTLDHHIEQLARPANELDPQTLAALRLGLYQLVFLDGVAAHAAVGESSSSPRAGAAAGTSSSTRSCGGPRAASCLPCRTTTRRPAPRSRTPIHTGSSSCGGRTTGRARSRAAARRQRAGRARAACEPAARDDRRGPGRAGATGRRHAHRRRRAARGAARRWRLRRPRSPALRARARTPRSRAARCSSRAPSTRSPASACSTSAPRPAARRRTSPRSWATRGRSSPSSATRAARPGCSARRADGRDVRPRRTGDAAALCHRTRRLTACSSTRRVAGWARCRATPTCAGGWLRRRSRRSPAQAQILQAARAAVRPGGAIVYSTCTLSPAENEARVAASGLPVKSERLVLPHRDRTDGFYIARLEA